MQKQQVENQKQDSQRQTAFFDSLSQLQKLMKQELLLVNIEHEQKTMFQKKLHQTLFSYYSSSVHLGESSSSNVQTEKQKNQKQVNSQGQPIEYQQGKKLLQDEGLGDVYTFVKEIILTLSKDPFLMMTMIKKCQNSQQISQFSSLIKVIVSSMYQNIVDDDVFSKDILKIVAFCLKIFTQNKKHFYEINFDQQGMIQMILGQIVERSDVKNYAKQLIKNTLLEIAKLDHVISFSQQQEEAVQAKSSPTKAKNKQSSKQIQQKIKTNNYNLKLTNKLSKIQLYSEGLRVYDQKIRKGAILKKKYRNCISDQLLEKLGINEEVCLPYFSFSNSSQNNYKQDQINQQLGLMFGRSNSQQSNRSDISAVKNIILIFFNDLFKMLYSMPSIIRITCYILFRYLSKQFTIQNSLKVVADFVINFWSCSALSRDISLRQASKIAPFLQHNVKQVITIIRGIVKDNFKQIHQNFTHQFYLLVANLKVSITNYINQTININKNPVQAICEQIQTFISQKVKPQKPIGDTNRIRSYCVCLNMVDIQKLMQMIKQSQKQLNQLNDKLFKRVKRIQLMTQDSPNIFGDKLDRTTGKYYRKSKAFALFSQLSLPSELSIDYKKQYNNAFKKNKVNNVLRQVLLNLNQLNSYQFFHISETVAQFFQNLKVDQIDELYSIDSIPIRLKLQYFQMILQTIDISQIIQQVKQQTSLRLSNFKQICKVSKQYYLKAISSLNFQNQRLGNKQISIRNQIKRRKLDQFCQKTQIKLCLTSPKTRQKQIVLKTNLMKEVIDQYRDKLWLQNQTRCIHAALNLDFIKSLTGEPQKNKNKYECHINNIMKFPDVLCSLPQVKQRFNMIQDTIGVKQAFFDFIHYVRDLIRDSGQKYHLLIEDVQWLQENIELKISKKLYDKLYPKYPIYDDIALYIRLKTLDWVSFHHFDSLTIQKQNWNWNLLQVAANHLKLIDKLRTASEKLQCISECEKIIVKNIHLMSKQQKTVTADQISPLMILALIRAAPKRLISSINFIQSFASQARLLSKQGYCYAQLKGAVRWCDTATAQMFKISPDTATNYIQYNKLIYQKEIEYGIYFMLGRRQSSPQSQKRKLQFLRQYFKNQ